MLFSQVVKCHQQCLTVACCYYHHNVGALFIISCNFMIKVILTLHTELFMRRFMHKLSITVHIFHRKAKSRISLIVILTCWTFYSSLLNSSQKCPLLWCL